MRRLGQGAFAQVYAADDVTLRRRVAIKVLNPALADERAFLRRFAAEAQAVAGLRHPHILRVYDWGEEAGDPYLVMELLEGGSLRSYLDRGRRLSVPQAARLGADVASALDYAHRRGLVHRDIKPANLIFDDEGRIALADFGLARALAEATLTEPSGSVVGTARYAAPEALHGQALDGHADVYGLALVLVEAVTGQVPFAMDTSLATLMGRLHQPIAVPSALGPLGPVLEAAGTVEPGDRLDAAALAARLDTVAAVVPPPARLVLAGPLADGEAEIDSEPTDIPGRTDAPGRAVLFDLEEDEDDLPPPVPAALVEPPPPPPPPRPRLEPEGGPATAERPGAPHRVTPAGAGTRRRSHRRWRPKAVLPALGAVALLAGGGGAAYVLTRPQPTYLVPALDGRTVPEATALVHRSHLDLIVAGRAYSPSTAAGRVLSEQPVGGRLTSGKPVAVVVSKGPRPVPVPALSGKTLASATAAIAAADLRLGSVTKTTSMTVPAGSVIKATPSAGTLLPHQRVGLVLSTGKPTAVVPKLSGASAASYAAASAALAALGLPATQTKQYSNDVPAGQVIVTDPAPGVTVTVGTPIDVEVSLGPHLVVVPDVAGDSVTAAAETLGASGFAVSSVNGSPLGTVTSTYPGIGQSILYGSSVTLTTG